MVDMYIYFEQLNELLFHRMFIINFSIFMLLKEIDVPIVFIYLKSLQLQILYIQEPSAIPLSYSYITQIFKLNYYFIILATINVAFIKN